MMQEAGFDSTKVRSSRLGTWLTRRLRRWLERQERELTLRKCGGDQLCPWCRQWMNGFTGTYVRDFPISGLEEITCGNCWGTSLWKWEMGFFFVCAGEPPTGAYRAPTYGPGHFIRDVVANAHGVLAERHAHRTSSGHRPHCGWTLPKAPAKASRQRDDGNPEQRDAP